MITLLNIDCMEYMSTVPDKYFDLCITDPPYNLNRKYNGNYNDKRTDYKLWSSNWFGELSRITRIVIFSCGVANLDMWYSINSPKWLWCWFKGNNMGSGSKSTNIGIWEPFLIYGDAKKTGVDGKYLPIIPQKDAAFHDCPKPLKLIKLLVNEFGDKEYKIIDPFLGSGTSAIAAYDFGVKEFVGCEIDKEYYDAALKRFNIHKMQQKLF